MTASLVQPATHQTVDAIVDGLVLAFTVDPAMRWMYPQPQQYLQHFPAFLRAFGGAAFEYGTAYSLEGAAGAALWLPPTAQVNTDPVLEVVRQTIPASKQADLFAVFDEMATYHPHEPHWYLAILGVEHAQQRKGYGSVLMKQALAICDRDETLAYLESSNPANIPFYERHGFEVVGTIQPGNFPPIFPMIRYPRCGMA